MCNTNDESRECKALNVVAHGEEGAARATCESLITFSTRCDAKMRNRVEAAVVFSIYKLSQRIILVLPSPLLIQLIDNFLSAPQYLQCSTLVIMISGLWYEEVCRNCARHHESAHDLQHLTKVFETRIGPCVLVVRIFGPKGVCEENLD